MKKHSKYTGVTLHKKHSGITSYYAYMTFNGEQCSLGVWLDEEAAAEAVDAVTRYYCGTQRPTNFVGEAAWSVECARAHAAWRWRAFQHTVMGKYDSPYLGVSLDPNVPTVWSCQYPTTSGKLRYLYGFTTALEAAHERERVLRGLYGIEYVIHTCEEKSEEQALKDSWLRGRRYHKAGYLNLHGVTHHEPSGTYRATTHQYLRYGKTKTKTIGYFPSKGLAAAAVDAVELAYYGDLARLNFPRGTVEPMTFEEAVALRKREGVLNRLAHLRSAGKLGQKRGLTVVY